MGNINRKPTDEKKMSTLGGEKEDIPLLKGIKKQDGHDGGDTSPVGFFQLFRYASRLDIALICLATFTAMGVGFVIPIFVLIVGRLTDSFVELGSSASNSTQSIDAARGISQLSFKFIYIGLLMTSIVLFGGPLWSFCAQRQANRIRIHFFNSVIHQNVAWFDSHKTGDIANHFLDDIEQIRTGIGESLQYTIQNIAKCIGGITVAFFTSWELSLVITTFSGCVVLPSILISSHFMRKLTQQELADHGKAGAIAEEVLSAIRTVAAFGGQEKECKRYCESLHDAKRRGIKKNAVQGLLTGTIYFALIANYGVGVLYGSRLYLEHRATPGDIFLVFVSLFIAFASLGNTITYLADVNKARAAASIVWRFIDRKSEIDSTSDNESFEPKFMSGRVEFKNVCFSYPSRNNIQILDNLNFKINVGETVALVGSSGCGKSTTLGLLQRYYDIGAGKIEIDGKDIRNLNIHWLRKQIGVVSQEPILFATSILENIQFGNMHASFVDVEKAAIEANAHDFITSLPNGYHTLVGDRGVKLSGGQKQRIAIARALVRNPKILLLDEATSALDRESEATVQDALDRAKSGRTTIAIAHRLSTIRYADNICVMEKGRIVENGKHDDLMQVPEGIYRQLVMKTKSSVEMNITAKKEVRDQSKPESTKIESTANGLKNVNKSDKVKVAEHAVTNDVNDAFSLYRTLKLQVPELVFIAIGIVASAVAGALFPFHLYAFSLVLESFTLTDKEKFINRTNLLGILFFALGTISLIANAIVGAAFGKSGEELTLRVRTMTFRALLRQDLSWFDDDCNNVKILSTRLATEASAVKEVTGARLGDTCRGCFSMALTLAFSLYFGWQVTLLFFAFLPPLALLAKLKGKLSLRKKLTLKQDYEKLGQLALETLENIRTVISLTCENKLNDKLRTLLHNSSVTNLKDSWIIGLTSGASLLIFYIAIFSVFHFTGYLVTEGLFEFQNILFIFVAFIITSNVSEKVLHFISDFAKAKIAMSNIFKLVDLMPDIDCYSGKGGKPDNFNAILQFENVYFSYPTRSNVAVLNGMSVSVCPGESIALVGTSGCGKSTIVNLTERFYDPLQGNVYLDKFDIKTLNIQWLRSQIGLVSQEPVLFSGTIARNIAYGDNTREVSLQEIMEKAKVANIHCFIQQLPQGYDTKIGERGTQLSGGQKQRIAIARALIRNPKLLLLDEATSALDAKNEEIVQEALNEAKKGRTCIVIAHRLSTIRDADKIAVVENGQISELGTHDELMQLKGKYYQLYFSSI